MLYDTCLLKIVRKAANYILQFKSANRLYNFQHIFHFWDVTSLL